MIKAFFDSIHTPIEAFFASILYTYAFFNLSTFKYLMISLLKYQLL